MATDDRKLTEDQKYLFLTQDLTKDQFIKNTAPVKINGIIKGKTTSGTNLDGTNMTSSGTTLEKKTSGTTTTTDNNTNGTASENGLTGGTSLTDWINGLTSG